MTSQDLITLAYTKSPITSRRKNFQNELKAAVAARASKTKTEKYSYSDEFSEFSEDENELLSKLLKSRKKRSSPFVARKSKSKINDFEISDEEGGHGRRKRVSFLKTQRIRSPSQETAASASGDNDLPDSSVFGQKDDNGSFSSQHSKNGKENDTQLKIRDEESTNTQITRASESKSLPYQTSEDILQDMPLPLPSDNSTTGPPGPEEESYSVLAESSRIPLVSSQHTSSADSASEKELPKPKPRPRTIGLNRQAVVKMAEDAESQDLSRPQISSVSIPVSIDTSISTSHPTEGFCTIPCSPVKSSSFKSENLKHLANSTVDSRSRDGCVSDDSEEQERKYLSSLEESNQKSGDYSDQLSHSHEKSFDSRASSSLSRTSKRSQKLCSRKVESKYLGSLKVLDGEASQPQAADSIRAAYYQNWLQKKKEKSRESVQLKKKEETLKESKKREEEAKREGAVASYEAWKQTKTKSLKAKAKEKQDMIRKEQRATEDREEKRQTAKKVFEEWKHEHDQLLKQKYRKQKDAESKILLQKQESEEERKRVNISALSNWREKKKDLLCEKASEESNAVKNKIEEDRYMKEERDKQALEMYENWLTRKDRQQRRQREERRIQAVLRNSPPPPWSPPNKVVQFQKKH